MSFLTDLFEGKDKNLVHDITGAPASFVRDIKSPEEWGPLAAAAALALPFAAPEIGTAIGLGDLGLGAADAAAGGADLATALGAGDIATAADAATAATAAGDVAPAIGDALAFSPTFATDALTLGPAAGGDFASLVPGDVSSGLDLGTTSAGGADLGPMVDTGTGTATPGGFAPTDAELSGATTGTGSPASGGGAGASSGGGAASGEGSWTDTLKSFANSPWTRLAVGAAPLALALARGEPQLPSSAVAAQGNAAALSAFGNQQLQMGISGTLNAGQMAALAAMRQDLTNQFRQALYNQGVTNPGADTRWAQMEAQIDIQVTAQTQVMIQQNIQNGLSALGAAGAELNQIAQMQMQADTAFTTNLVNATKALAFALPGTRPTIQIGA